MLNTKSSKEDNVPTVIASHCDITNNDTTALSGLISAGAVSAIVKNNTAFQSNDFVVLENIGVEQAELLPVANISGFTAVTLGSGCRFSHSTDTSMTKIGYDKVRFYSAPTKTGSYSLLATVNMRVDYPDGTPYNDTVGTSTTWYKITYYNSTTTAESSFSDSWQGTGIPDYSLRGIQDRVVVQANDPNEERIIRDNLTTWVNEVYRKMQQILRKSDESYALTDSGALPLTNGTDTYSLLTTLPNLAQIFKIWLSAGGTTNASYNECLPMDLRDDDPHAIYSPSIPAYAFQGDSIIFRPMPTGGYFRVWYYPLASVLVNDGDTLEYPYRDYTDLIVDYCMMRFAQIHKPGEVQMYDVSVKERLQEFRADIIARQVQYPKFVRVINHGYEMSLNEDII